MDRVSALITESALWKETCGTQYRGLTIANKLGAIAQTAMMQTWQEPRNLLTRLHDTQHHGPTAKKATEPKGAK
jgi:hypothetical protein